MSKNPEGEYYLSGVMETAAGLKINEDHTFEFFYSYGALDRHGYGNWKPVGDEIELNTDYQNLLPFTIIKEEKHTHTGTIILIPNYNQILQRNTKIELFSNKEKEEQIADNEGYFKFNANACDKFIVTCVFYFDNPATLIPTDKSNNYFELAPNHNLPLVHFNGAKFKVEKNELRGKLHLMDEFREYSFISSQN